MVKLASARECRLYGPHSSCNRWEHTNAGLYVLSVLLIASGFSAQLPGLDRARVGLLFILGGLVIVAAVNAHDFMANVAGIDYRLRYVTYDIQLGLVDFAVPLVQMFGCVAMFYGIYLLFIQGHARDDYKLEIGSLVVGPMLWLVGSIGNSCQTYEQSDGVTQVLQSTVYIPFLMGSLLFLVGGFINVSEFLVNHHTANILENKTWILFSMFGSVFFLVGGMMNVFKVFRMQRPSGQRLEKLRGGAQQLLTIDREVHVPILDESSRKRTWEGRLKI